MSEPIFGEVKVTTSPPPLYEVWDMESCNRLFVGTAAEMGEFLALIPVDQQAGLSWGPG